MAHPRPRVRRARSLLVALAASSVLVASAADASEPPDAVPVVGPVGAPGVWLLAASPDGRLVAATVDGSGDDPDQLCVLELDALAPVVADPTLDTGAALPPPGSMPTDVVTCAPLHPRVTIDHENVAWAPDSSALAFSEPAFQYLDDGDIWILDVGSGELRDVTDDGAEGSLFSQDDPITASVDVAPAWSPDGATIAFSRSDVVDGEFRGNVIATIPATGGDVTTIATVSTDEPGAAYRGIAWADDTTVLYSREGPDPDDPANGVWRAGLDAEEPEQVVAADPELGPPIVRGVSPDGEAAVLFYPRAVGELARGGARLFALADLTAAGAAPTPIGPDPDDGQPTVIWAAAFSPTDGSLAVVATDADAGGPTSVATWDAAAATMTPFAELVDADGEAASARWAVWTTAGTVVVGSGAPDELYVAPAPG